MANTALHKDSLSYDKTSNHFWWAEDVVSLQALVAKILNDDSIASGDVNEDRSHNMRSFKAKGCTVKFYSTTKKVITQGPGSVCVVKALSDYLESGRFISVTSSSIDNNGDLACSQAQETKADEDHRCIADGSNPPTNPEMSQPCECSKLKFENIEHEMEKMKNDISFLLNNSKTSMQMNHADENELNLNNKLLRDENSYLKAQLGDLKSTVAQLKGTIASLETEKACLVTSLRILQQETTENQTCVMTSGPSQPANRKVNTADKSKLKKSNRDKVEESTTASSSEFAENEEQRSVVILGDSIIKGLQWWKMSRKSTKVHMKSFPGSTVEDMESYMLPTLRSDPDEVILHIGTNDLPNNSPRRVAEHIANLSENIGQNSKARVTISGIIQRKDDPTMKSKVAEANKIIRSFASNRGWGFIDNSKISSSMLNHNGLHLTKVGSSALAKNILNHLSDSQ